MAGDWIPMRTDLWDCPQVVRILSARCPQGVHALSERVRMKSEIIGALYRTWSLFDAFSDDGLLHGYDAATLNETLGIDNWAEHLEQVGWLVVESQSLAMPEFTQWLGQSAKRRLKDAQRKREAREKASAKCPQSVRNNSDENRTTGQDRTGQNNNPLKSPKGESFDAFWNVVHVKIGKDAAKRAFAKAVKRVAKEYNQPPSAAVERITARMAQFAKTPAANPKDHSPIHPATWLNQGRYADDVSEWQRTQHDPAEEAKRKRDEERAIAQRDNDKRRREAEAAKAEQLPSLAEGLAKRMRERNEQGA